nr:hypothetical protein [Tanacetum cinerariifolium]
MAGKGYEDVESRHGEGSGSDLGRQETMIGAMAQVRPKGASIQSIDPPLSTSHTVGSGEDRMEHEIVLTDPVPQTSHDPPLLGGHTPGSDEGSMTLNELTDLYTTLLQKRQGSRISGFHPFRTATSKRRSLGRRKVSKQGMKNLKSQQKFQDIDDLVDEGMNFDLDNDADIEMIVKDKGNGEKEISTTETVSTARLDISAARPEVSTAEPKTPTTTTLFDDEDVTIADTLVKMKNQKAKEKGIAFKDADDSTTPIRSITTLQPLPTIDPKDKGKCILQESEPVKKTKKKNQDQIKRDAKVALKIQANLNKQARTERERQKEASKAALAEMYDEVQAHIDVDHELAARLTYEEQEKYTIEERFNHAQLKIRSLEEIQKLYIKEHKWVDAFVPIGSEEDEKRIGSRKKRVEGSSSKHKSPKKQKVNDQESNGSDKGLRNG